MTDQFKKELENHLMCLISLVIAVVLVGIHHTKTVALNDH
jgi:hypothetical protein